MSVTARALGDALRARLGPDGATDDPAARAAAAVDGVQPSWVARPRSVEFRSALPRTSMGKVHKRALREPFWAGQERQVAGV